MSQIERDTMKQIDKEILSASPEFLKLIQKHDLETNYFERKDKPIEKEKHQN